MGDNSRRPLSSPDIRPRSIAVLSGKGGSGKTLVAAVLCDVLDHVGVRTLLVDTDTGTGGLTYFLVMKIVRNTTMGLSDMLIRPSESPTIIFRRAVQHMMGFHNAEFLGIGDHRRFHNTTRTDLSRALPSVIRSLSHTDAWRIIDCRGGIDADSLAVCGEVDDILLIAEPDTTSFQATAHLVDVLSSKKLAHKVRGFILNKAFSDPRPVAHNGTSAFKTRHLASVPFDFEAMRSYLVGELPPRESPFSVHVWEAASKLYPDVVPPAPGRVWSGKDFEGIALTNLDSYRGGLLVAGMIILLGLLWTMNGFALPTPDIVRQWLPAALGLLALLGSLESSRRVLGRGLAAFVRHGPGLRRSADRYSQKEPLPPPHTKTESSSPAAGSV